MGYIGETNEWAEFVTQFETTDPIIGGAGGIDNEPHEQLAARTNWLRAQWAELLAYDCVNTRFIDPAGDAHEMVWVPRFRVTANSISSGVPERDLLLGGFFVGKYLAVVDGDPQKMLCKPWENPSAISPTFVNHAVLDGNSPRLMSIQEFGHLVWLNILAGRTVAGNNDRGRFNGSSFDFEAFGEIWGLSGVVPSVSGPTSWFHNGRPSGIKDLWGNLAQMVGFGNVAGDDSIGRWGPFAIEARHYAELDTPLAFDDTSVNLIASANTGAWTYNDTDRNFWGNWPLSAGWVRIGSGVDSEVIQYGELVVDPDEPHKATLTGCVRDGGLPFSAGETVSNHVGYNLAACVSQLTVEPMAATSDDTTCMVSPLTETEISVDMVFRAATSPAERMRVKAIDGFSVTFERGFGGTTPAEHGGCLIAEDSRLELVVYEGVVPGTFQYCWKGLGNRFLGGEVEEFAIPEVSGVGNMLIQLVADQSVPFVRGRGWYGWGQYHPASIYQVPGRDPKYSTVGVRASLQLTPARGYRTSD